MNFMNEAQLLEVSGISNTVWKLLGGDGIDLLAISALGQDDMELIWDLVPADIIGVIAATGILVHFIFDGGTKRSVFPGNLADGTPFLVIPVDRMTSELDVYQLKIELEQIATGRLRLEGSFMYWDDVQYDLHVDVDMLREATETKSPGMLIEYVSGRPWLLEVFGSMLEPIYISGIKGPNGTDVYTEPAGGIDKYKAVFSEAAKQYDAMKKTNVYFKRAHELQYPKFENL